MAEASPPPPSAPPTEPPGSAWPRIWAISLPPTRPRYWAGPPPERLVWAASLLARKGLMGVYEELGLQPIINASGSVTRLGGAPMPPAVLRAFAEAAAAAVPLDQLQGAASRVIAEVTGTEAGLVSAGAAAAL